MQYDNTLTGKKNNIGFITSKKSFQAPANEPIKDKSKLGTRANNVFTKPNIRLKNVSVIILLLTKETANVFQ